MEIIEVVSMRLFREKKERKRERERATMFVCNRAPCSRDHFFETFDVSLSSTTDASSVRSIKAIVSKRYRRPKSSVNNPISLLILNLKNGLRSYVCSFRGISSKAILLKKHTQN